MSNPAAISTINKSLNCNGCGALLSFVPGTHSLQCSYCGSKNDIDAWDGGQITPYDYEKFISTIDSEKQAGDLKVVVCNGCGSQSILDLFVTSDQCPFCTAALVLDTTSGQQYIPPHYILPFQINQEQVIELVKKWVRGLWWSPNNLEKTLSTSTSKLKGIYIPHWLFDTDTVTNYRGERGDYYYRTETYTVTVNGKPETRTRQVRHTRWSHVSGTVQNIFRDETVPASRSLPYSTLNELGPWNYKSLVRFDERYMSGFRSETYQVTPQEGFESMKGNLKSSIENTIKSDIGGDEQRIASTATRYYDNKIKYTLLPLWHSSYVYKNKVYPFSVNASTGEVIGERPLSALKITLAVITGIVIIAIVILWLRIAQ